MITKRISLTLLLAAGCALSLGAQSLPSVGMSEADACIANLSQQGWQPQGASLSYDGQSLYLSLVPVGQTGHDLYVCRREGSAWRAPECIEPISTDADEVSPVVSPDNETLYFVRIITENAGTRKERQKSYLYSAARQPDGTWSSPQMLVISNGADREPKILLDNHTLLFRSVRDEGRHAEEKQYWIRHLDKYNWTLPQEVTAEQSAASLEDPMLSVRGQVTDAATGQSVSAMVDVYDDVTKQRLASHRTDEKGVLRVALEKGRHYLLDIHRDGYTHHYYPCNATTLERTRTLTCNAALSPNLSLVLHTYDSETLGALRPEVVVTDAETGQPLDAGLTNNANGRCRMTLPIGLNYRVRLSLDAYADTSLLIDTRKDVLLAESEVDMLMRAGRVQTLMQAVDAETGQEVLARLVLHDVSAETADTLEMPAGETQRTLRCLAAYRLVVEAPGYFTADTTIQLPGREGIQKVRLPLLPLREEMVVELRNIEFEFNSYLLTESSYEELRKVADLMRRNPQMRIQLSAHTDDIGGDAYNKRLSQKRGEEAVRYLIETEGIASDRLLAVGYGKERPLVPNDSEEHRARNRRVEFSILAL